jgi:hypothetical protein
MGAKFYFTLYIDHWHEFCNGRPRLVLLDGPFPVSGFPAPTSEPYLSPLFNRAGLNIQDGLRW